MSDQLEQASIGCKKSRDTLLASVRSLSDDGPALRTALTKHAQRYLDDPARGRVIREQAGKIDDELRRFGSAESNLLSRVAIRGLQSDVTVTGDFVDRLSGMFDDIAAGRRPPSPGTANDPAEAFGVVALGELTILTQVYEMAAGLLALHRSTIETYVGEYVDVSGMSVLSALRKRLNNEGEDAAVEIAADVALKIGSELVWFLKIVDQWRKLRKAIEELEYRGAGPEDHLLDLIYDLKNQNDRLEACAAAI